VVDDAQEVGVVDGVHEVLERAAQVVVRDEQVMV